MLRVRFQSFLFTFCCRSAVESRPLKTRLRAISGRVETGEKSSGQPQPDARTHVDRKRKQLDIAAKVARVTSSQNMPINDE